MDPAAFADDAREVRESVGAAASRRDLVAAAIRSLWAPGPGRYRYRAEPVAPGGEVRCLPAAAVRALPRRRGGCLEWAAVLVGLARALDIPAQVLLLVHRERDAPAAGHACVRWLREDGAWDGHADPVFRLVDDPAWYRRQARPRWNDVRVFTADGRGPPPRPGAGADTGHLRVWEDLDIHPDPPGARVAGYSV